MSVWTEVIDGLWQGGDGLSPVGEFDHVVSLCGWTDALTPGPDDQTEWFIADGPLPEDLDRVWEIAGDLADRLDRGERVLVRCQMGLNRSGLLVGAVLIQRGWAPEEAVARIRTRRGDLALSNPEFEAWLRSLT